MQRCFLIFGFGYSAKFLAKRLVTQGFRVIGTRRALKGEEGSLEEGVELILFNSPKLKDYLTQATHLLVSTPPSSNNGQDPVLLNYRELIKQNVFNLDWVGYLSSTSVYGDYQGQWVSEDSPCIPHSPSGIARLKAENDWLQYSSENHLPLHVFRLAGIYGPGRSVLERIRAGKKYSVLKEGQVFGRMHIEDIVSTLLASIEGSGSPLSLYNLCDDEPASTAEVDLYATSLMGRAPLPIVSFSEADLSPMEKEFYSNNRRVSNAKIKKELGVKLNYPSYREGLKQIWREHFENHEYY